MKEGIFISHTGEEKLLAARIQALLRETFGHNTKVFVSSDLEAPKNRVFSASEVPLLRHKGWADITDKFGKGISARYRRTLQAVRTF